MAFKTLLVHVAPGDGEASHVQAAVALARRLDATLVAIGSETFRPNHDRRLTWLDGLEVEAARRRITDALEQARAQLLASAEGVPTIWRTAFDDPDDLLVRHACGADLIVAGRGGGDVDDRTFAETEDLVLESGLPVLVVPAAQGAVDPDRVLVAWKNTREARRALGDALPLLKLAQTVHLVGVRDAGDSGLALTELEDVTARLARHGVEATSERVPVSAAGAGEILLELAQARDFDLIVAGAYGHSRLRQWMLGGATGHLLRHAGKPVLFSR